VDSVFFVGILALALIKATPIAFGSMSGLMCERSGVINIAIEGMMLIGAMMAFLGSVLFNNLTGGGLPPFVSLTVGLVAAMLGAGLIGLLHAYLSIHYKVDQIITSGIRIRLPWQLWAAIITAASPIVSALSTTTSAGVRRSPR